MGAPRCPKCGQLRVRRCPRVGILERMLSTVSVYPFRCQLCGRRFRAIQWGARHAAQPVDRRELDRVPVRAPLTLLSDRGPVEGEVTEISLHACTARLAQPPPEGGTMQLELHLLEGERPITIEAALLRSVRGDAVGLYFVRVASREQLRLRRVMADLDRARHGESVPTPSPARSVRAELFHSADFWLTALLLILATLAVSVLVPALSRCLWGLIC